MKLDFYKQNELVMPTIAEPHVKWPADRLRRQKTISEAALQRFLKVSCSTNMI